MSARTEGAPDRLSPVAPADAELVRDSLHGIRRGVLGFRECSVADAKRLGAWLAREVWEVQT